MTFRLASPDEYPALAEIIIDSFEPITWFKSLDQQFGPLNGCDWRQRWRFRLDKVFASQIILTAQAGSETVAVATGTYDSDTRLGFVDLLAVHLSHQGKGYGRLMLQGFLDHLQSLGAEHAHLECLSDNIKGNSLYQAEGWTEVARSVKWFKKLS